MNSKITNAVGIDNFEELAANSNTWCVRDDVSSTHYILNLSYGGSSIAYTAEQLSNVTPNLPLLLDYMASNSHKGHVHASYVYAALRLLQKKSISVRCQDGLIMTLTSLQSIMFDKEDNDVVYITGNYVKYSPVVIDSTEIPVVSHTDYTRLIASSSLLEETYPGWQHQLNLVRALDLDIENHSHIIFPNTMSPTKSISLPSLE